MGKRTKPRTKKDVSSDPRVDSIHREHDELDGWSWWVYLKDGWVCPMMGCGTIHESTIKEVCDLMATVTPEHEWMCEECGQDQREVTCECEAMVWSRFDY